jgi:predicted peroxiredoxin
MNQEEVQIVISSGLENVESAVLGFSLAAAAVSVGTKVSVFLTMSGARWALKSESDAAEVPGFQPISELIEAIQTGGGAIEVCANCAPDKACSMPQADQMRSGIVRGGLATVAIRMGRIPTIAF